MKISLALGLASTLGAFALMGGAPNTAHAATTFHSGTVCRNYNAAEAKDIDYLIYGARNLNSNARFVICPLVRQPDDSNLPVGVVVQGHAASGQRISCTLYSYDYQGNFLGAGSASSLTADFQGFFSANATYLSSSAVLCLLPPSGGGFIRSIEVFPYFPIQ